MAIKNFYDLSEDQKREFLLRIQNLIRENRLEEAKKLIASESVNDTAIEDIYQPFPLSDIQESFSVGKHFGEAFDKVGCHVYFEFSEFNLDVERLNKAWNTLVAYHEMLHVVVLPDRTQKIIKDFGNYDFKIFDVRGKSGPEVERHFQDIRERMSHKLYPVEEWPLFEICITKKDGQESVIHFSMDEWIIDGFSLSLILNQWYNLYKTPGMALPQLKITFREYLEIQKKNEGSPRYLRDLEYWMNKYKGIPGGPALPWNSKPSKEPGDKYFRRKRYSAVIDRALWSKLKELANRLEVSKTALMIMCFLELLSYWSKERDFSIIATYFNRPPVHPDIDKVVGPFVSTNIFSSENTGRLPFKEKVALYQKKLWNDLDHSSVSGIRALREIRVREKKAPNLSIPIVFTSMLNTLGKESQDSWLEKTTYSISQTPQVCLDHQVYEYKGNLNIIWDVIEAYFQADVLGKMFAEYVKLIETVAENDQVWDMTSLENIIRPKNKVDSGYVDKIATGKFPLSDMQQTYIYGRLQNNVSCQVYQEFDAENIDIPRLQNALNKLIATHDMLRAVIDGQGYQQILAQAPEYIIEVTDYRNILKNAELDAKLADLRTSKMNRLFPLNDWPLFNLSVTLIPNNKARIHFAIDAIVADGRSISLLYQQLFTLYLKPAESLEKPTFTFREYLEYIQRFKKSEESKRSAEYWKVKFLNLPPGPKLPYRENKGQKSSHGRLEGKIENWQALKKKSREMSIEPGAILFTAYTETLSKWSQAPFTTVFVAWERPPIHPQINTIIGEFTSLSWVETKASGRTALEKIKHHQETIRKDLTYGTSNGLSCLRKKMMLGDFALPVVYTNYLESDGLGLPDGIAFGYGQSFTPGVFLDNMSYERGDTLFFNWDYDQAVFPEGLAEEMFAVYQKILNAFIDDLLAQETIDMKTISAPEQYSASAIPGSALEMDPLNIEYSKFKCIHELFEEQVRQHPDSKALTFNEESITYQQLNDKANQLANYLRKHNCGPETLVGICMERSLEMIISILGILKSGGAYVPLDPYYPKERRALIIEDSQVPILITEERNIAGLQLNNDIKTICLERERDQIALESTDNPQSGVKGDNIAYVIYTSGSTGKPKGALICHYNVTRLFESTDGWFGFNANDVWTMFHSYAFDFSVWEIWGALLYGGRLVVVPYTISRAFDKFYQLVEKEQVTVLNQTPTAFKQFMSCEEKLGQPGKLALRYIIFGGEALNPQSLRPWFDRHGDKTPQLINMYGITETTVHVTYRPITSSDLHSKASVIGSPIPDLQLYILDEKLERMPVNTPGELYVGGLGLARGYLKRPDLTSEKFIPNPFSNKTGAWLYKTGDLAMYLPDGDIEYLGRIDLQVKIRGFRIELGDIETALLTHEQVKEAVVTVRDKETDDPKIVAYIVPKNEQTPSLKDIRHFIRTKLPDYMVPNVIGFVEGFRLTENGKLDRKALPWPIEEIKDFNRPKDNEGKAIGDVTAELIAIFKEALETNNEITEQDDIFDLGATSITIMTVTQAVGEKYQVNIPVEVFLTNPVIKEIAQFLIKELDNTAAIPNQAVIQKDDSASQTVLREEANYNSQMEPSVVTRQLVEIFKEALETKDEITADDDIFDLGATSLTIMSVSQAVGEKYQVNIPVEVFLTTPTIKEIAQFLIKELDNTAAIPNQAVIQRDDSASQTLPREEANENSQLEPGAVTRQLVEIFRQALETTDDIKAEDDIFDLGATSITIMTVSQMVNERYQFAIPVEVFLTTPNINDIAQYLWKGLGGQKDSPGSPENINEVAGASPALPEKKPETISLEEPDFKKEKFFQCAGKNNFGARRITFADFSNFLALLKMEKVKGETKYMYPSSGGRNCVQTYVYVKANSVEGLAEGVYYYHPLQNCLFPITKNAKINPLVLFEFHRPVFEKAAFMVFFVAQLNALQPVYVDYSKILSKIDTGYMAQLLVTRQAEYNIGLYPVVGLDFEAIKDLFKLDEGHIYIYSLLGGYFDYSRENTCFNEAELANYAVQNQCRMVDRFLTPPIYETIPEVLKIQGEKKFNILSKKDLVELTRRQPHIRKFTEDSEYIPLTSRKLDHCNYNLRSCQRHFINRPVSFENFSKFISLLEKIPLPSGPRGLYTPPSGVSGLDIYLYIYENGVEGMDEGAYLYNRDENSLTKIKDRLSIPVRMCHTPFNLSISKEAKFFIFLVGNLQRINPILGEASIHYAEIEAGMIGQILLDRQSEFGMGLVPIGGMDFEKIRQDFKAELDNIYIHSFMCGPVEYEEKRDSAFAIEFNKEALYFPLSYGQRSLFFVYQSEPSSSSYNTAYHVRIKSELDLDIFKRALDCIIMKHPLLRTTFIIKEGAPYQVVHPKYTPEIIEIDASTWDHEKLVTENIREYHIPFQLENQPAFRITLFNISENDRVLMFNIHHIITDYSSTGILVNDLWTYYSMLLENPNQNPPVVPDFRYFDYITWQDNLLKSGDSELMWNYWKEKLGGELPVLNLHTDKVRPAIQTFNGATLKFTVDKGLTDKYREYARREKKTLYTIMLSIFNILLYRYSGQDDILVGTTANARGENRFQDVFGYFINPIVIRGDLSGEPTFRELLERVSKTVFSALNYQNYPFPLLVEKLQPKRDASRSPVFQVTFQLLSGSMTSKKSKMASFIEFFEIPQQEGQFDLEIEMMEEDCIYGHIMYNSDLFTETTMEGFKTHFLNLIQVVIESPNEKISAYDFLTGEEKELLLDKWNDTKVVYPGDVCIHHLFEQEVLKRPNEIAVICKDERSQRKTITYHELNYKANQMASHLKHKYYGSSGIVGICMNKSLEIIIAVMAVFKAGLAYIPIDPAYPTERRNYIITNSNIQVILTTSSLKIGLEGENLSVVNIDKVLPAAKASDGKNLNIPVSPKTLAYIIYTSGSTGTPKGVKISHEGAVNIFRGYKEAYLLENICKTHLQMASFTFDVFIGDFMRSLCSGGKLVLCPREYLVDPERLYNLIVSEKVEFAEFVPAVMRQLVQYLKRTGKTIDNMKGLVISSDSWNMEECNEFRKYFIKGTRFISTYGVTEVSIDSTYIDCDELAPDTSGFVPIGRPFQNTQIYILDKALNLSPLGVPGELCIGGKGVALGYLNSADLTARKFIPNIFSEEPDERIYRTGDLVRYLPNGVLEFLGRIDHQIKIRGLRVELGEIETVFTQHSAVKEAIVMTKKDQTGENILIGFYTESSDAPVQIEELQSYFKKKLPEYMMPTVFVKLETFPLNSSGKIDRKALHLEEITVKDTIGEYIEPRSDNERKLVEIWKKVLQVDKVGITNNFFNVGGHSFLTIKLLDEIEKELQIKIPLSDLLINPTIEHLAGIIDGGEIKDVQIEEADFAGEESLPDKILPEWRVPRKIFLTGATGHLGVNLLSDLLNTYESADVYCLVRAKDDAEGRNKLEKALKQNQLWRENMASRIALVLGDLEKPRLGLSEAAFDELAKNMDIIFHNGAFVNFVYPYSVLKKANVDGTIEILKLAVKYKTKPLHYISTTSVFENIDAKTKPFTKTGVIEENTPLVYNEKLKSTLGYTQSKWVAENIVRKAQARGVPVAIYRPDVISGHSVTGIWNTTDYASRTLRSIALSRIIPKGDVKFNWMPVDYVSKAIVHLSTIPDSINKNFNLTAPHYFELRDLGNWISAIGYPVRTISFNQWLKMMTKESNEFEEIPREVLEAAKNYDPSKMVVYDSSNTRKGLQSAGIECPAIDQTIIEKYFTFFMDAGFIQGQRI